MNRSSVARELLRVARLLSAAEYPVGTSEKGKRALDALRDGIEAGEIWNADWKEINRTLSRSFENVKFDSEGLGQDVRRQLWPLVPYVSSMAGTKKGVGQTDKIIKKGAGGDPILEPVWSDIERRLVDFREALSSWLPILDLKKQVKPILKKGRKPSGKPLKEVYVAPMSAAGRAMVRGVLKDLVDDNYRNMVGRDTERYLNWAKRYVEERDGTDWPRDFFEGRSDAAYVVRHLVEFPVSVVHGMPFEVSLKSGVESKAKAMAEDAADELVERFLIKNEAKLGSVVGAKGDPSDAKVLFGRLEPFGFGGEIRFDFDDGTSFVVRNKAVMKWSGRKVFYQFPTTFHSVVFPDGKKKSMVPEKAMNEVWAKA